MPHYVYFVVTLELGMKQGLQGEIKAQKWGDLKDNFKILVTVIGQPWIY
jgi:hypothetical protein